MFFILRRSPICTQETDSAGKRNQRGGGGFNFADSELINYKTLYKHDQNKFTLVVGVGLASTTSEGKTESLNFVATTSR